MFLQCPWVFLLFSRSVSPVSYFRVCEIDIPISSLSSEEIYALLEDIDSNYEEENDNLMNDSETEFVYRTAIQNSESDISEAVIR